MIGSNVGRVGTSIVGLALAAGLCASGGISCTQTREAEHAVGLGGGVPKHAEKLASASGAQGINITADKSGTVYVNDESTAQVVYSGKVAAGDPITVDGGTGTITVGPYKKDVKLNHQDKYAVYIDP